MNRKRPAQPRWSWATQRDCWTRIARAVGRGKGVLALYAASLRDDPTRIRIFETYADVDAYNAHIKPPHFLKYKTGTLHMIRSLTLIEADPILLGARP
jgi:quinol monooxygenase YgiN